MKKRSKNKRPGTAKPVATKPAKPKEPTPKERFAEVAAAKQAAGDDSEDELWRGSYSPLAMVGSAMIGTGLSVAVVALGIIAQAPRIAWPAIVAGIGVIWLSIGVQYGYRRLSVKYTLTTQRLLHEAGLLWRTVDRVELIDVDDVSYRQGPIERLLSIGTVVINSSDTTTPILHLVGIERVREIADTIDNARRLERRARGLHIETI